MVVQDVDRFTIREMYEPWLAELHFVFANFLEVVWAFLRCLVYCLEGKWDDDGDGK